MNINITMTEAEFDEYRVWREHKKKTDFTRLRQGIGDAVKNFVTRVEFSHIHPLSLGNDIREFRREVDAALEDFKKQ
jgi:hypothetical protein